MKKKVNFNYNRITTRVQHSFKLKLIFLNLYAVASNSLKHIFNFLAIVLDIQVGFNN